MTAPNSLSTSAEQDYLEDNIATVAFHLGRAGAAMSVDHPSGGLNVSQGEVLKEVSRRLTVAQAWQAPVAYLHTCEKFGHAATVDFEVAVNTDWTSIPLYAAPQPASNAGGEKALALLRWGTWEMTPAARLDWKKRAEAFLADQSADVAYSSPESLADRVISDKTVIWLRECGFQSAARFESELRAAVIRACSVPSTDHRSPRYPDAISPEPPENAQ